MMPILRVLSRLRVRQGAACARVIAAFVATAVFLCAADGSLAQTPAVVPAVVRIPVDDFKTAPEQGDSVWFYNRLNGDRGALEDATLQYANGSVTVRVASGRVWGGMWESLSHPIRERAGFDTTAVLPAPISAAWQSRIDGLDVQVGSGTAGREFRLELKDGPNLKWSGTRILSGSAQDLHFDLPSIGRISEMAIVLDRAAPGDFVTIRSIAFTARTEIRDVAVAAFVWSYGMLLANWDPASGLIRDKARDASGEFDAVQVTGLLAAASALAHQLGVIPRQAAVDIVVKIESALEALPRHRGLWPHFVRRTPSGQWELPDGTEYSSIDTVIAMVSVLAAESALALDTSRMVARFQQIDWAPLLLTDGISHGYSKDLGVLPHSWDAFGQETWLIALAYASSTGQLPPVRYPNPPTANGSGFIDFLAHLFVAPPKSADAWGTNWIDYRTTSVAAQVGYFLERYPQSCFASLKLFGLSAAEVPGRADVPKDAIYAAFGVGGQFASANDGVSLTGRPVITPHYAGLMAAVDPDAAIRVWSWLISNGLFSPLTNVESLSFETGSTCLGADVIWNDLRGSWNLGLQALGLGEYLTLRDGVEPAIWSVANSLPLKTGYSKVTSPTGPTASLDRQTLNFGAVLTGATLASQTPDQTVALRVSRASGAVTWTAASNKPWLTVFPASGSGAGTLTVGVKFDASLPASGEAIGAIMVTLTGAANTLGPLAVTLTVTPNGLSEPPFGSFDTPSSGASSLQGSLAVTGWALDDVGVDHVEIWRDLQPGETTPAFAGAPGDPRTGKVLIAPHAPLVRGARPDVEGLYPKTPRNDWAGWGYLLLTWGLWQQGNGTYTLWAYAFDKEGKITTLGSKSIGVSNATATKPFGSIDTPAIGGVASGPNFGWGLTPKVNGVATCKIPATGVQVSIDSGPLQQVAYGDGRADIAEAFPGFSNSAGAGGHFIVDWNTLPAGLHTIGWLITDDCSRAEGVGSRFFTVTTGTNLAAADTPAVAAATISVAAAGQTPLRESDASITVARGYGQLPQVVEPELAGLRKIEMQQGERIEVRLPRGYDTASQVGPDGRGRGLPTGATWDGANGIFYWQPAAAFLGRYRIVFSNGTERITVAIIVGEGREVTHGAAAGARGRSVRRGSA